MQTQTLGQDICVVYTVKILYFFFSIFIFFLFELIAIRVLHFGIDFNR